MYVTGENKIHLQKNSNLVHYSPFYKKFEDLNFPYRGIPNSPIWINKLLFLSKIILYYLTKGTCRMFWVGGGGGGLPRQIFKYLEVSKDWQAEKYVFPILPLPNNFSECVWVGAGVFRYGIFPHQHPQPSIEI